jgi:hypothetical protein
MFVAVEMEIDLVARLNLRSTTSCGAAFDAKNRAKGRLPQSDYREFAELFDPLGKPDGDYSFAFTMDRRSDGGDEDELAFGWDAGRGKPAQSDLGGVAAIGFQIVVG